MLRCVAVLFLLCGLASAGVDFPVAYVRVPRNPNPAWYERWNQAHGELLCEPNSDLMLLLPDGSERVLVDAADHAAVLDPMVSLDGKWIYYAHMYYVGAGNGNAAPYENVPGSGSEICKVHVETGEIVQLTHGERDHNTGVVTRELKQNQYDGVFNLSPCPLPDGRVAFVSSRSNFFRTGGPKYATAFQLYVMDEDGKNVEKTGHLNLAMAAHPTRLVDGRIMWSTQESQGYKDFRNWSLWASKPDGRTWEPVITSLRGGSPSTWHWQAQTTDESIVAGLYYNSEFGGGTFHRFPLRLPEPGGSVFGSPDKTKNPYISQTPDRLAFQRVGMQNLTPWAEAGDNPALRIGNRWMGKVSHPSPTPNNGLLLTWLQGPVHSKGDIGIRTPKPDGAIAFIRDVGATPAGDPLDHLDVLVDSPDYNEIQPVAVLPFERIYGQAMKSLPFLPNDGTEHELLPAGTPFALIGTSSFYAREDSVNGMPDWGNFGSVSGKPWTNADIHSVRIVAMEPTSKVVSASNDDILFRATGGERLRELGVIPLRKFHADGSPVLDSTGDPDTSFLARVPADTPYTFQTLDKDGRVLNMAQTWHQARPGEVRQDCRGCHAHHEPGIVFEGTAASKPEYRVAEFTTPGTATTYEFWADILPLLEKRCATCHDADAPGGFDVAKYRPDFRGLPQPVPNFAVGYRSRESKLSMAAMGEIPACGGIPEDERRIVNTWIDLGCAQNVATDPHNNDRRPLWPVAGVKADDLKPTLYVSRQPGDVLIGAYDYETGLKSLTVTDESGAEVKTLTLPDWRWKLAEPVSEGTTLIVTATDDQGNATTIARTFRGEVVTPEPDPEPTPDPEKEELKRQVAALTDEIARLMEIIHRAMMELESAE